MKSEYTLGLFERMKRGEVHVLSEIWLPNQEEVWEPALAEGSVLSLGQSLGTDWQSAFVIPAYLQEQYPGLDSVEDLKNPRYKALFSSDSSSGKARLVSCVIGWACETVNAAQIEGYGLSEHVEIVNPGDGAALNASLYYAYERREPWLGYQWGTNDPALQLDLVRLEERPYSDQCWFTTKACAYEDALILLGVHHGLLDWAPEVVAMLRNWDFNTEFYGAAVRWWDANTNADTEDVALWWLNTNREVWGQWVTSGAKSRIEAALNAGHWAYGWP